jgi:phage-related protein
VIQGVLAIAAGAMTGDWTTAMAAIRSANDLIWNGIRTVIEGVLNAILAYFGTTVDQVVTEWTTGLNQLATSATTAVNNALTALRTAIAPAVDIGTAIINGIVSGVSAAAGALADVVAGAAADALQAAKDALGIHSPSAVFRDQVGKQISAGMSEGVIAGGAGVASATTQVAQGAVRGAQSITVNQNINGGSMDADRLANQTARMLGAQLAARG